MRELSIDERLNRIKDRITVNPFSENKSLGNGNGGYIFDYDPGDELLVRGFIKRFKDREDLGFRIKEVDLFEDVLLKNLEDDGYLEEVYKLEDECSDSGEGFSILRSAIMDYTGQGSSNDIFVEHLKKIAEPGDVLFLTGVGKCHPFIRSHQIIDNFDSKRYGVKTVLFYPGSYDCETLKLFGTVSSEGYYRAPVLIGRVE